VLLQVEPAEQQHVWLVVDDQHSCHRCPPSGGAPDEPTTGASAVGPRVLDTRNRGSRLRAR
jgi:hypothetical protein